MYRALHNVRLWPKVAGARKLGESAFRNQQPSQMLGVSAMMGMDFRRLNKVFKKHKWTPSKGHKDIDSARRKEELLLAIVAISFIGLLLLTVVMSAL